MQSLFGIPMGTLMAWMLAIFLVVTAAVTALALRNRLFFKMGLRNIPRRRAQTVLIIVGLMLSTVIITSAFGTGDTLSYSIRSAVTSGLGSVDEAVFHVSGLGNQPLVNGVGTFSPGEVRQIQANVAANPAAESSMPALISAAPLQDLTSGQTKAASLFEAFPATYPAKFGALTTSGGATVTLGQLQPGEAYINAKAANSLSAHAGDTVDTYIAGTRMSLKVRAVLTDDYLASGGLNTAGGGALQPAILVPIERLQSRAPNVVLVSNVGSITSGADHTDAVTNSLRALLANPGDVAAAKALLTGKYGDSTAQQAHHRSVAKRCQGEADRAADGSGATRPERSAQSLVERSHGRRMPSRRSRRHSWPGRSTIRWRPSATTRSRTSSGMGWMPPI